ncbi:HEPN/Toprim-associated domain-containing protein [Desulfosporosinus sp. BICA1-9]|uniref:HEPN/Toprim-associated domain-containing protein n=1 Tax=Desulfosporosinus sp. BICA1-9 TaxID=1531958 RepID=UPI00054B7F0B|nr:HEPN/Toprim-associated domain-containing protein [Desulfosporosinus sp. BICA1-9]KJS50629.1 MAG: hypothetical protein VR66_01595 [Peptococcaceae bacterium BRH_c23]KJS88823.1 MAG: hypothetical protein JL57_10370 [Desulfosporosinus sp. BICA1-9]HBW37720.1 hypothetical protein [Desulfosporosinus sp.]
MGSMITLGIDKFEIDWGKNNSFTDHSCLFQRFDVMQIPYYYADDIVEMKEGFSRKLGSLKKRLDLLGYSFQSLKRRYVEHLQMMPSYYSEVTISFEQFLSAISSIDLQKIVLDPNCCYDCDLGEFVSRYIFADPELSQYLPEGITIDKDLGTFFENLDPYITLRLLAEKDENADFLVQWRYADIVEGGWVSFDEVFIPLSDTSKILVVTEGSSDSFIIKRSINALYPDISDFFYFVDMEENYPFTGTGNLFRFCQGLSRIKIQNNILVIFDNDAAGIEKFEKCRDLSRPKNLHICKLPDHEYFSSFRTIGPNGESVEDINGSAVAIECFLDMSKISSAISYLRWTSYNRELDRYQGELEGKDALVRAFRGSNLTDGSYNTDRLRFLLDYLVDQWVTNAS